MTHDLATGAAGTITLSTSDKRQFTGVCGTRCPGQGGIGIVILPGGRGLLPAYTEMADRFTRSGIHAVAIDHFGRWAGLGIRDEQFDFAANLPLTSPETTALDVARGRGFPALRRRRRRRGRPLPRSGSRSAAQLPSCRQPRGIDLWPG